MGRPCRTDCQVANAMLALQRYAIDVFFLPLVLFATVSAQRDLLHVVYENCGTLATNSTWQTTSFASDLNTTLVNFTELSAQGVTYAITNSSSLYAMFQCRGDLSNQSCSECVQNATSVLPVKCPQAMGANLRLIGCVLRYDNQSFFHLDVSVITHYCTNETTNDSVTLSAIDDEMQSVISEAPKASDLFAYGNERSAYAIAECWRYLNESDCAQCLTSTSYLKFCDSKQGGQVHLGSCDYRFELYDFLDSLASPAPLSQSHSGQKTKIIIVVVCAIGFAAFIALLGALCYWKRHKKTRRVKGSTWVELGKEPQIQLSSTLRRFSLEELNEATDHFSFAKKIGKGGFGIVYKGTLSDRRDVAIKKLHTDREQDHEKQLDEEFLNEVNLLAGVQHKNLIKFVGCCAEGKERILVTEYLRMGSLDVSLFGSEGEATNAQTLDWSTRCNIVTGMARGLAYLHEESHLQVIHRDIKASNILLDDKLRAVITDFGIAKLVRDDATNVATRAVGTMGYMAPEIFQGTLSTKVDVFSFGVVTLEIISGRKNLHHTLLKQVWEEWEERQDVGGIVDARLGGVFSATEANRLAWVALLCTQEEPELRPTMHTVIQWLSGTHDIGEVPRRPTNLYHTAKEALNPQWTFSSTEKVPGQPSAIRLSAPR